MQGLKNLTKTAVLLKFQLAAPDYLFNSAPVRLGHSTSYKRYTSSFLNKGLKCSVVLSYQKRYNVGII